MCSGEGHGPLRWHAGLNYGAFQTDLHFSGGIDAHVVEHASSATLEYRPGGRVTYQVGGGVLMGGWLTTGGRTSNITPGWVYSAAVSTRLVDPQGYVPFVLLSVSGAVSSAGVSDPGSNGAGGRMVSIDVRLGATLGWTLWNAFTPYATARVFGGPIFWDAGGQERLGTDAYHFQLGTGAVLTVFSRVDLYAELVFLGEQRLSAGAGVAF